VQVAHQLFVGLKTQFKAETKVSQMKLRKQFNIDVNNYF